MSPIEAMLDTAVSELESRGANWEEFSVVWTFSPAGKANGSWGYWFATPTGEPEAFTVRSRLVRDELKTYLDELYPDGNYPIRILVQFNRESGRYNVEFEDTDTARWMISPANWEQTREALRPNLS